MPPPRQRASGKVMDVFKTRSRGDLVEQGDLVWNHDLLAWETYKDTQKTGDERVGERAVLRKMTFDEIRSLVGSNMGRSGGRAKSKVKGDAARVNGKKGGRPSHQKTSPQIRGSVTVQRTK